MKKRGRKQGSKAEKTEFDTLYGTDDFRMYCFKVLPCSKNYCHDWTDCPFAHTGEKAKRRDPALFPEMGTECPQLKEGGGCPRGDTCPYAHNVFECWLHPSRYRTQLCNEPVSCRRKVCFFAHSVEELREPNMKTALKRVTPEKGSTQESEAPPHSQNNAREQTTYIVDESTPAPKSIAPTYKDFSDHNKEEARVSVDSSTYGWQSTIQDTSDRRTVSFDGKATRASDRETSVRQSVDISTLSRKGKVTKNPPTAPMDPLQKLMNEIEAQNIKFSPADISAAVEYLTTVQQQSSQDVNSAQHQPQMGGTKADSQRDQIIQLFMLLLDNMNDNSHQQQVYTPNCFHNDRTSMDSTFTDGTGACRRLSHGSDRLSLDSFTNNHLQYGSGDARVHCPVQVGRRSQEMVSDFIIHDNQYRCSMDSNSSDSMHFQQYAGLPPLWEDQPSSQTSLESHEQQGMLDGRIIVPASSSFFYQPSNAASMHAERPPVAPQPMPVGLPSTHCEGLYGNQ